MRGGTKGVFFSFLTCLPSINKSTRSNSIVHTCYSRESTVHWSRGRTNGHFLLDSEKNRFWGELNSGASMRHMVSLPLFPLYLLLSSRLSFLSHSLLSACYFFPTAFASWWLAQKKSTRKWESGRETRAVSSPASLTFPRPFLLLSSQFPPTLPTLNPWPLANSLYHSRIS